MVQVVHNKGNSDIKDEIIAAAQKRFGLYGYKKTSMIEIANDLKLSKGLLYYYFPDKEHLYNAVIEKEVEVFQENVSQKLQQHSDPAEKLREFAHIRLLHFRSLLNLSRFRFEEFQAFKKVMCNTRNTVKQFEKQIMVEILEEGKTQLQFNISDSKEIAELLFDLMRGIRMAMVKDKHLYYLEQEEYNLLVKKTETFINIFIQGISK